MRALSADAIHGHSSHHVKGIEVYKGNACGDFLNDSEGIAGCEAYRDDLGLMYFASMEASNGLLMTATRVTVRPGKNPFGCKMS